MTEAARKAAEKLLKPHSFRYQDRATAGRLGISAVEATGVEYWKAVDVVADLLAQIEHLRVGGSIAPAVTDRQAVIG